MPQIHRLRPRASGLLSLAAACLLAALAAPPAIAQSAGEEALARLKPPICGQRPSCQLAKLWPAGHAPGGTALAVVEAHLGLKDKPEDAPEDGCREEESDNDGGREYWLVEGANAPRLVMALCNDGYGAAGRGQDTVEIGDNRMSRLQLGGSNLAWQSKRTIQLVPRKMLTVEQCGFRVGEGGSGAMTWIELSPLFARTLALDGAVFTDDNQPDDPCEVLAAHKGPGPERGFLAGTAVPLASGNMDPSRPAPELPEGATLGDCAARLLADGKTGFTVFGAPDAARVAELRFIAPDAHTLLLELYDPRPDKAAAASWIGTDHFELWASSDLEGRNRPDPATLTQIGVGLDGSLHQGVGKAKMPTLARWQARDEQDRPVTVLRLRWEDDGALVGGLLVAYSEADGGKQARIFATAPIVKNRPQYLPGLAAVPISCAPVAGRWQITANEGGLGDSEN